MTAADAFLRRGSFSLGAGLLPGTGPSGVAGLLRRLRRPPAAGRIMRRAAREAPGPVAGAPSGHSAAGPGGGAAPGWLWGTGSGSTGILKGIFIVVYTTIFPLHLLFLWLPTGRRHPVVMTAYIALFALGTWAWRHELARMARQIAARKLRSLGVLLLGFVGMAALETLGDLLQGVLQGILPAADRALDNEISIATVMTLYPPLLIVVVLGVFGPVVEELAFRQVLIPAISLWAPRWVAVVVSGVLFGMLHMHALQISEWVGVIGHACFGLAMGILYVRTRGNLLYSIAVHSLVNLSGFVVLL